MQFFPLEVIIVEQDSVPRFRLPRQFRVPTCHIFVENSYLFNRAWGFNIGMKHANSNFLFFADSDMIVCPKNLAIAVDLIANQGYDAVSPFTACHDLSLEESTMLSLDTFDYLNVGVCRTGIEFCSGIVGFTKTSINRIGGWDERFEGWGGEDDIQSYKTRLMLSHICLANPCFHLFHSRSDNDGTDRHSNYSNNFSLFAKFRMREHNMAHETRKTAKTKSKAIVSDKVKDYGNDPFFVKKAKESKAFLEKHGFPKELVVKR